MGYSEVLCHICGVSFNIGRIRTPSEPRSAAWNPEGPTESKFYVVGGDRMVRHGFYPLLGSYVDGSRNSWTGECSPDAGCMFVMRKVKDEKREIIINRRGERQLGERNMNVEDDEQDVDWVPEEEDEDEDEPLEYASDLEEGDVDETMDVEMKDAEDEEWGTTERETLRRDWIMAMTSREIPKNEYTTQANNDGIPVWHQGPLTIERIPTRDDMFPLFRTNNDGAMEYSADGDVSSDEDGSSDGQNSGRGRHERDLGYDSKQYNNIEHIAGSGCCNTQGYSGHKISVEEMRGCQVAQCLVRKPQGWTFEPMENDDDFEKEGAFFLSGLTDHMPSRDMDSPRVQPPRHGCEKPYAENYMWDEDRFEDYAMPFHPYCFEVYKRASLLRHGTIDVDGLTSWWTKEAKSSNFDKRHFSEDVGNCRDQWWVHRKGTEYLAANPLYIPKLRDIFQRTISTAPDFTIRNNAFQALETSGTSTGNDPFACLPAELRITILDGLRSKDIAALRLASRTFVQMPISYFQKLINRELPWLWEAWPTLNKPDSLRYSFWATVTAGEAERKLQSNQKEIAALSDYVSIVSEEMPELKSMLEEALPGAIQAVLDAQQREVENDEDRRPYFLPPDRTNYYMLYVLIRRHWLELQGLKNRRRIWKECRDIVSKIERLKSKEVITEKTVSILMRTAKAVRSFEERKYRNNRD